MSSARLEIIDDTDVPIHVSRSMPAALDGLVSPKNFGTFCDKLDDSLQLLVAEHTRSKTRFYVTVILAYLYVVFIPMMLELPVIVCILYLFLVPGLTLWMIRFATSGPVGTLSAKDLMDKLRADCEDMTLCTRHVSFHVVLLKNSPYHCRWWKADVIDHIAVSVSLAASTSLISASLGVHSAVDGQNAVSDKYHLCSDKGNGPGNVLV